MSNAALTGGHRQKHTSIPRRPPIGYTISADIELLTLSNQHPYADTAEKQGNRNQQRGEPKGVIEEALLVGCEQLLLMLSILLTRHTLRSLRMTSTRHSSIICQESIRCVGSPTRFLQGTSDRLLDLLPR
jgi:hypothetical protein